MREDSVETLFLDKLSKYGISSLLVENVKIARGSSIEVYMLGRKEPYLIKDPSLVRLAKLMSMEQEEPNGYKLKIIRRIFGLECVYGGMKTPFSQFKWYMSRKSSRELTEMLLDIEKDVEKDIRWYSKALEDNIYNMLAEKPPQELFEEAARKMLPEELENLLAELSDKKHPRIVIISDGEGNPIGILPRS